MLVPPEILMDFRACDNLIAAEDRIKFRASQVRLQGDLPLAKTKIRKEERLTSINKWHRTQEVDPFQQGFLDPPPYKIKNRMIPSPVNVPHNLGANGERVFPVLSTLHRQGCLPTLHALLLRLRYGEETLFLFENWDGLWAELCERLMGHPPVVEDAAHLVRPYL